MTKLPGPTVLLALAVLCLATPSLADPVREIGRFKRTSGPVSVQRQGQLLPAAAGMVLYPADVIVTGKQGLASLSFIDQTRLALGAEGRLRLDHFEFDEATGAGRFESTLATGRMAGVSGRISQQKREAMRLRTPTALLGIHDAEFVIDASP